MAMTFSPWEELRQIAGLITGHGEQEEEGDREPGGQTELALNPCKEVIDHKHPQQHQRKPVATLHVVHQISLYGGKEILVHQETEQEKEKGGWDELHPHLLQQELGALMAVPYLRSFV